MPTMQQWPTIPQFSSADGQAPVVNNFTAARTSQPTTSSTTPTIATTRPPMPLTQSTRITISDTSSTTAGVIPSPSRWKRCISTAALDQRSNGPAHRASRSPSGALSSSASGVCSSIRESPPTSTCRTTALARCKDVGTRTALGRWTGRGSTRTFAQLTRAGTTGLSSAAVQSTPMTGAALAIRDSEARF